MLTIKTVLEIILEKEVGGWKRDEATPCLEIKLNTISAYVLHAADFGSVEDKSYCRGESQIQCKSVANFDFLSYGIAIIRFPSQESSHNFEYENKQ